MLQSEAPILIHNTSDPLSCVGYEKWKMGLETDDGALMTNRVSKISLNDCL